MRWPGLGDRLTTTLMLLGLTLVLSITGTLSRIDNVIYDTAQRHTDRDIPSDVVLVTIDEQSLSSLGRWPWSRRLHAQLMDRLHADGAKVIGYDVMFAESQSDDPLADQVLAQALARAGNVVLPVVIEKVRRNGQLIETLPLPALTAQSAALGRVHAELDADAIARSITLWEGLSQPVWPHFAQSLLAVANQLPSNMHSNPAPSHPQDMAVLTKQARRYINFTSAQRHLLSLSFVQVLRGEFTPGTFSGKLVLVGSTASGMADSLPTPVSGFQQPMPGVEFLANTVISMRAQTLISLSPLWLSSLLACGLALLPMLWLPYVGTRTGLLTTIAFATLSLVGIMAMPVFLNMWLPLSAGLLGVLSAYPIWAWRKLESASHFLDTELTRLHHQLGMISMLEQPQTGATPTIADPFQRRIVQVRTATTQLQQLEQSQRDTLAFISHDIRVPLASAAAQIKHELGDQHPAHKQLSRALVWTEDFLQTSRAQMLRSEAFTVLDAVGMLHEAADDIYPLVQAKSLQLALNLPDDPIWVLGNAELLSRSIANLLSNALKFSLPGGTIGLSACAKGDQIHITITDQGAGIAPQEIDRLFKRYSRLEPSSGHSQTGVGLGLFFVQTTARQHGGTVQVHSAPGGTSFTFHLPLLGSQHQGNKS